MAAMALPWLVLIICFLTQIQAQQLSYLKEQIPLVDIEAVNAKESELKPGDVTGIFPPNLLRTPCIDQPNETNVEEIERWYESSQDELVYAKSLLESRDPTPELVDWNVSLYQLIIANIVNFRGGKTDEEPLRWIKSAAEVFELEYIPFTDLAWVEYPPVTVGPLEVVHSGPFCGVFVSNNSDKPFMILSFKGTTNELEAATNSLILSKLPTNDILYGQRVHMGMYNGLFNPIPTKTESAIDVIWNELERVAGDVLGGTEERPVPLYVSGHSLGAGYAQLAYVELFRKLDASSESPRKFNLSSLYAFAAPRVGIMPGPIVKIGLANKVHEVFQGHEKPIFRYSTEYDVVPFAPGIITLKSLGDLPDIVGWGFIHLDGGYILHPDHKGHLGYFTNEASERGGLPKDDPHGYSCWEYHFPTEYYHSIKKILDSEYEADAPGLLTYNDGNGGCESVSKTCKNAGASFTL